MMLLHKHLPLHIYNHLLRLLLLRVHHHLHHQQLTVLVPGCVVNGLDDVLDVTVHFPNEVGLITPMIPPLGDPI
jgi:hypothetical protein